MDRRNAALNYILQNKIFTNIIFVGTPKSTKIFALQNLRLYGNIHMRIQIKLLS